MQFRCIQPTAEIFYGLSIFTFGFNVIAVPQFIQHRVCYNKYNASICKHLSEHPGIENDVQSNAADWMSIVPLTALLPAVFTVLIIGPLSDVMGKTKIMVIPPAVYLLQSLLFIFFAQAQSKFSPGLLALPYCLSGLFGDSAGCASLSEAYISSVTSKKHRTTRLAMLESAVFIGQFLAALSSSLILSELGYTGGFALTATVNFVNLLYVLFLLPPEKPFPRFEGHSRYDQGKVASTSSNRDLVRNVSIYTERERTVHETTRADDISAATTMEIRPASYNAVTCEILNPINCFKRILNAICTRQRLRIITAILLLFSLASIAGSGEIYLGILYVKHSPFNLKASGIGYLVSTSGLIRAAGLVTIPYICQRYLKFGDMHIVMLGFCTQVIYYISLGFVRSVKMLYVLQVVGLTLAVHFPVFRSMVTKLVDADQYGSAAAAVEVTSLASSILTSLLSNQIYSATVNVHIGLACILLGILAAAGLFGSIIFYFAFKDTSQKRHEKQTLLGPQQKETSH